MLDSHLEKNKKIYRANKKHPIYSAVNEIIHKQLGFDQIFEKIVQKLGNVYKIYLTAPLSQSHNKGLLEIIMIGEKINGTFLNQLIEKVEKNIGRGITHTIFKPLELKSEHIKSNDWLLLLDMS